VRFNKGAIRMLCLVGLSLEVDATVLQRGRVEAPRLGAADVVIQAHAADARNSSPARDVRIL
jgi:hypothetical protein